MDQLLRSLTEPPILAYPDYNLQFLLHVDASSKGLGAVFLQQLLSISLVTLECLIDVPTPLINFSNFFHPEHSEHSVYWTVFVPFFRKKSQKINNFLYSNCVGINFPFITSTSLFSPGRLVSRYWPWFLGI